MEKDIKRLNPLLIKPMVASLIIACYYAGLFNGSF